MILHAARGRLALVTLLLVGCGRSGLDPYKAIGGDTSLSDTGDFSDVNAAWESGIAVAPESAPAEASGPALPDATSSLDAGPFPDASIDAVQIPPGCNAWTCANGCCESDGGCSNLSNATCGMTGDQCEKCASDEFCRGPGSCFRLQPNCNATNCRGCCTQPGADGYCATGVHNALCGHDGEGCARCIPSEGAGQCVSLPDGGGTCSVPVCSPANCAGCCYGNVCSVGTQNIACGKGGVSCADCTFFAANRCVAGLCSN